jgi:hypothetical protein
VELGAAAGQWRGLARHRTADAAGQFGRITLELDQL